MTGGGGRNWRLVRADTDAVPSSVRRFMARARRRRLRAALPWVIAAAVAALAGVLTWVVYGTAVLGVRHVEVVGTELLVPLQVEQAAAIPMREPLAALDLDAVRARVRTLAPVERAVVRRSWPSTVVIEVVERTPVAAVPSGDDAFAVIDGDGMPYRTLAEKPANLPLIRLATPGTTDVNTRSALTVLTSLSDELREQLAAISVATPAQIKLELTKDRVVVWGDDTQSEQKSKVATALLSRAGKEIDVSAPSVVTIR